MTEEQIEQLMGERKIWLEAVTAKGLAEIERDRLREAALVAQWALRAPADEWKGECERKALDALHEALAEMKP